MGAAKYMEVVEWIQQQIENKELLPGTRMYSENELSKMFHLSRQTIRHAIGLLEEKGIVIRVKGSGTYININLGTSVHERTRVALITTYVNSYIFPKTIQGIEKVLSSEGYTVQISFTNNLVERERSILEDLIRKNDVGGIIIEPARSGLPNPNLDLYEELTKLRIPILFINSYYPQLTIPHISLNDKMVAQKATNYLIQCGHKKIGAIFKLDDGQGHQRYAGFMKAVKNAGLTADEKSIVWIDTYDLNHLSEVKDYILRRLDTCTAVLCYNDQVASGLIKLLNASGKHVPEDLSVIGIDGSDLSRYGDVQITTIPHPVDCLGEKAARNLLEMIRNPVYEASYEFDADILEHNSVRKL